MADVVRKNQLFSKMIFPVHTLSQDFWVKALPGKTHPKVREQWCVRVSQHGVAGTQSLHVHISSEGGGGWVGQSLSWTVLLVVVTWRPGCHSMLKANAGCRGCSLPSRTLQPSITDCSRRLRRGASSNIRAEDAWISKRWEEILTGFNLGKRVW